MTVTPPFFLFFFLFRLCMLQKHNMHMRDIPSRPKHAFFLQVVLCRVRGEEKRHVPFYMPAIDDIKVVVVVLVVFVVVPGGFSFPPFHSSPPDSPPLPLPSLPPPPLFFGGGGTGDQHTLIILLLLFLLLFLFPSMCSAGDVFRFTRRG
ncbi:hypothetical protein F4809DRAFT_4628 [Biscogniauxia mediterranea]|nr:hypothetical protein F4809DRAFT_4628 [Biscogniauxia mediterranea]